MSKGVCTLFFSEAFPLENIEAVNSHKAAGVIDFETGNFAFRIQIQDFIFEKSLGRKNIFNENYMESEALSNFYLI